MSSANKTLTLFDNTISTDLPPAFVDVLLLVILLYVVQTTLTSKSYSEPPQETQMQELILPPIDLADSSDKESSNHGITQNELMFISMEKVGAKITYYVDSEQVQFNKISGLISSQTPSEVCLRVDGIIQHQEVMRMIEFLKDNRIHHVSFAVNKTGG